MFTKVKNFYNNLLKKENRFNNITLLILVVIFFVMNYQPKTNKKINKDNIIDSNIHIFIQQSCKHCRELEKFINEKKLKNVYNINYHDLANKDDFDLLSKYAYIHDISLGSIGTPMIFTKTNYLIGFENSEDKKKQVIDLLENNIKNTSDKEGNYKKTLKIPFFGEIKLFDLSLPALTILVGLADGFNPCAMWVLVYLLSITITLGDKKKIWFLVGSFVLSSGILYYLFMTAWLNAFLFIGYVRLLNLIIGLFALYFGIITIHDYIKNKGQVVCKLENNETRNKSMSKIRSIVNAQLSTFAVLSIVFLAFVVNSIEFVCSAALPATYTYILTKANLSNFMYYMYLLLYDIMFMADDIIVFGCAVFAMNKYIGTKYEKYSTIIGGSIMFIIGIFLVFFPDLLR